MEFPIHDGSGNAETRRDNTAIWNGGERVLLERFDKLFKAGKIARGVALFENLFERSAVVYVGSEIAFCSANVARDDHRAARLSGGLSQLLWSVLLCEFEHTTVVIALGQSVGRVFINDENHVRVKLKC